MTSREKLMKLSTIEAKEQDFEEKIMTKVEKRRAAIFSLKSENPIEIQTQVKNTLENKSKKGTEKQHPAFNLQTKISSQQQETKFKG